MNILICCIFEKLVHVNYHAGGLDLFCGLDGSASRVACGLRAVGWK
jgi:hypothetical protein